jgi:hypothetical protein
MVCRNMPFSVRDEMKSSRCNSNIDVVPHDSRAEFFAIAVDPAEHNDSVRKSTCFHHVRRRLRD